MKLREASLQEVIQIAVHKLLRRGGGKEVPVFLPPYVIPPTKKAYKWEVVEIEGYGQVRLFAYPTKVGGWIVKVKFANPILFNPALPQSVGEGLLKKLQNQK
jgi:hypothetical protein